MSRPRTNRCGDVVVNVVVALVIVFMLAMVAGYALGWIKFSSDPNKSTVEFETREMQDAAKRAGDQAGRNLNNLGERTGEALRETGKVIHEATNDGSPNETSQPAPIIPPPILLDPVLPNTPIDPTPVPPATEPVQPATTDIAPGPPVAPEVIPDLPRR